MAQDKLNWIQGNELTLALPLQIVTFDEGEKTTDDYNPPSGSEIHVQIHNKLSSFCYTPTISENVLYITDNGQLVVGTYGITVTITEPNGTNRRSKLEDVLVVWDDNEETVNHFDDFPDYANGAVIIGSVFYGTGGGSAQKQSDWEQTNVYAADYIKHKPDIPPLANKDYDASVFSGLGRKYIDKNIVSVSGTQKNVLTQAMFQDGQGNDLENTIFVIQYDYEVNSANENTITIPEGCVLRFEGGSLSNGNLVYNNTRIEGNYKINCAVTGSVANEVAEPEMYGAVGDGETDDTVALQNVITYNNNINIKGNYLVDKVKFKNGGYNNTMKAVIWIDHSCIIHGTGAILANFANYEHQQDTKAQIHTIAIVDCENVTISGITIRDTTDTLIYEQSHAIFGYAISNVTIKDCVIKNICGDGIYIGRTGSSRCENIQITNNQITLCIRDGITISDNIKYLYIDDNTITECGYIDGATKFGYCIDAEPNYLSTISEDIFIRNNTIVNSISNCLSITGVRRLTLSGNYIKGYCQISRTTNTVTFRDNTIDSISLNHGPASLNEEALSYDATTGVLTTTTSFTTQTTTQSNNDNGVAVGFPFLIIKDGQKSLYKVTAINSATSFNVEYESGKVLDTFPNETCQIYSGIMLNINTEFVNNNIASLSLSRNYCPGVNSFMCKGGVLSLFKTNIAAVPYSIALDGVELTNESSSCISFPSHNINQQHPELSVFAIFDFVSFNNCSFKIPSKVGNNEIRLSFLKVTFNNLSFNECQFKDLYDVFKISKVTGDISIIGCTFENITGRVFNQELDSSSDGHCVQIVGNKFSKCTYRIIQQSLSSGTSSTTHVNNIIDNSFDAAPTFITLKGKSFFKGNTYSGGIISEECGTSNNPSWDRVVGSTYYNKNSGKPIYWNGTAWLDATGAPV